MWPFKRRINTDRRHEPALPAVAPSASPKSFLLSRAWAEAASVAAYAPKTVQRDYELPTPPPGVMPSGSPTMAQDDAISAVSSWAGGAQSIQTQGPMFPGYVVLAELAQRAEYRRGSAVIAEEMTRKWIKLVTYGEQKDDKIKQLEAALNRYRVRDVFRKAINHDGLFGIGHIYIDVGTEGDELTKPLLLRPEKIKRGGLKSIRAIEPLWCYPTGYNSVNPLSADYYCPQMWYVQGKPIHATRLLSIVGREVSDILKPSYMFGGLSRTMMARDTVENYLRTRQSVSDLVHSFSTMVLKTNLDSLMLPGSAQTLLNRIMAFVLYRDNRGVQVVDKETEELSNVTTPLGGLDALQAQSQEQQASVQAIPLVKLLGIAPSGLNASADGEIRVFYDGIGADQENVVRSPLTTVIEVVQLSEFGEIDPEIGFEFVPLWQMNEVEKATVDKTKADTAAVLIESGTLLPEEDRQRLASDDTSPYHGLDMNVELPSPLDPSDDPEMEAALRGEPQTEHAEAD